MNYLLAFDKFKGALSAQEACTIAAEVIREKSPGSMVLSAPLTDGGEGFASILAGMLDGHLRTVEVAGPRFAPTRGRFALVEGKHLPEPAWKRLDLPESFRQETVAFVEMASASGYENLTDEERDPWKTSTFGTGQLMKEAVQAGARVIVLGIGGSATNDCGAGALEALGVCYYDRDLQPVKQVTPETFKQINSAGSVSHLLDTFPPVRIACDVTNPLLGENGATRIFGPQKGLLEADTGRMERTLQKMATRILGLFGKHPDEWDRHLEEPGSGAAGGIGFALRHALPDSRFVEGFSLVADLLDLAGKLAVTDCLITGEGRLDESSLGGKGPVGIIRLTRPDQRVLLLAGSIADSTVSKLRESHPHLEALSLSDPDWPIEKALSETAESIRRVLNRVL